ncbi:hypothetical protein [Edaphobacter sp. HDX4]|uniref:hypothetical protein n=1 Tax=Edaphobacter sp. HDX4 TaxID=2794064 RepID=UPI002FE6BFA0
MSFGVVMTVIGFWHSFNQYWDFADAMLRADYTRLPVSANLAFHGKGMDQAGRRMVILLLRNHVMALALDQNDGCDQKNDEYDARQNDDGKKARVTFASFWSRV